LLQYHIPEQYKQRIEAGGYAYDQLAEAISCLEEAFFKPMVPF
jgi:hypothetical protein